MQIYGTAEAVPLTKQRGFSYRRHVVFEGVTGCEKLGLA
jgi:hypothetical protein